MALRGIGAALLIGFVAMSFQDSPLVRQKFELQESYDDTLPEKDFDGPMKRSDIDRLTRDLDKTLKEIGVEMKKIDFALIGKEVEKAIKEIDLEKIMKETQLSLQAIDLANIMANVKSSLKNINLDEKNGEIAAALKDAKREIEKATNEISDLDRSVIEKALETSKEAIEKARLDLKKLDIEKIIAEAKKGINKAKDELNQTKTMITEMEKDGLVDPRQGFSIEYKEKDLYINGTKQAKSITDKYRKYFKEDHFEIRIEKE